MERQLVARHRLFQRRHAIGCRARRVLNGGVLVQDAQPALRLLAGRDDAGRERDAEREPAHQPSGPPPLDHRNDFTRTADERVRLKPDTI